MLAFRHFDKILLGLAVMECGSGEVVIIGDGVALIIDVGTVL